MQGIAGAVTSPATLSIITSTLPEGRERNRGLALWGAMGALGASSGALLGGVLTQWIGWQAIFAVNVPLGAIVVALGLRAIPQSTRSRRTAPLRRARRDADDRRPDRDHLRDRAHRHARVGLARRAGRRWRWAWRCWRAFVYVEARVARVPLVPLSIFRVRRLRAANLIVLLMYAANFPAFFFITLYLQQVLHYDAIEAGLGFPADDPVDLRRVHAGAPGGGALRRPAGDRGRDAVDDRRHAAAQRRAPGRDLRGHACWRARC